MEEREREKERKGKEKAAALGPLCALFVQQGRKNLIPPFLSDDFWQGERETGRAREGRKQEREREREGEESIRTGRTGEEKKNLRERISLEVVF